MAQLPEAQAVMNEHFTGNAGEAACGIEILPGVKALLEALSVRRACGACEGFVAHGEDVGCAVPVRWQARAEVATCLVTGNLEPIGWTKMRALGIEHLFTQPRRAGGHAGRQGPGVAREHAPKSGAAWRMKCARRFGGFGSDFCSGNTEESWRDRAELVRIASKKGRDAVPGARAGRVGRLHSLCASCGVFNSYATIAVVAVQARRTAGRPSSTSVSTPCGRAGCRVVSCAGEAGACATPTLKPPSNTCAPVCRAGDTPMDVQAALDAGAVAIGALPRAVRRCSWSGDLAITSDGWPPLAATLDVRLQA